MCGEAIKVGKRDPALKGMGRRGKRKKMRDEKEDEGRSGG